MTDDSYNIIALRAGGKKQVSKLKEWMNARKFRLNYARLLSFAVFYYSRSLFGCLFLCLCVFVCPATEHVHTLSVMGRDEF